MEKPHPIHELKQLLEMQVDRLLPLLEGARMESVPAHNQEQQPSLDRQLTDLKEAELVRDSLEHYLEAELGRKREQRRYLEAELDREREQRRYLEAELEQERKSSQETQEVTTIDQHPQYQKIVAILREYKSISRMLVAAAKDGNTAAVKFLVDIERNALYFLALKGHLRTVQFLIDCGVQINATASNLNTPLHGAAYKGHLKVCKLLLNVGAQVNHHGKNLETPLICAASEGHLPVVQLLLEHGADVTLKDRCGKTACDWARSEGHTAVIVCLSAAECSDRIVMVEVARSHAI